MKNGRSNSQRSLRSTLTCACLLLSSTLSLQSSAQKLPDPIIVTIKEQQKSELNGLADVLIGSLGVAGVMILASILAAVVFAGLLFWFRSRGD